MRRLWPLLRPSLPRLVGALVVMALRAALIAGVAWMVEPILDEHLLKQRVEIVRWAPVLVLGFYTAKAGLEFLQGYWMALVGDSVCRALRTTLFRHAVQLPLAFYHRTPVPTVLARILNDVNLVQQTMVASLLGMLKDVASVIALSSLLLWHDWRLALLGLTVLPFGAWPLVRFGQSRRRRVQREQECLGALATVAHEGLAGAKVVKAFGMADYEIERFERRNARFYDLRRSTRRILAASNPVSEMGLAVAAALIVAYGGYELLTDRLSLGELASFFVALGLMYEPVKRIGRGNLDLQAAVGALDRIGRLLDEPVEDPRAERPDLASGPGTVELRGVGFAYEGRAVLRDVTLEVAAGETLALVGSSGAGKSTLLDLVLQFIEPTAGVIAIDGQDVRGVNLASLRSRIALVTQDVFLFDDSIRANVAYGLPGASDDAVARAIAMADLQDVVDRLPGGLTTTVGERGIRLSGGERQRVAIARAFLKDAPILILDEATSALDAATEARVQRSLERLMAGRTVLVVAHRLSTVQRADRIAVLDEGRIVEVGTHAELLTRRGEYARLYREQADVLPLPATPDRRGATG